MIDIKTQGGRVSAGNLVLVVILRIALYATILRAVLPILGSIPGTIIAAAIVAVGGTWIESTVLFHLLRWAGVTQPIPAPSVPLDTGAPPPDEAPGPNDCTAQHPSGANCRLMIGHGERGKPLHFNSSVGTWGDE